MVWHCERSQHELRCKACREKGAQSNAKRRRQLPITVREPRSVNILVDARSSKHYFALLSSAVQIPQVGDLALHL